jgi:hypothetical protein
MNFLPANYEPPIGSNNYFKLQEGKNRFRIMSSPIVGWEDWTEDKKPVRYRMENKPARSIDPSKPIKHFWAIIVYNCLDHRIQIMNITQATIWKALIALIKNDDWGSPHKYDIEIEKKGKGKETEYNVIPVPPKPLSQGAIDLYNQMPCNLEALFTNEDPFAKHWDTYTPMASSEGNSAPVLKKQTILSDEQFIELGEALNALNDEDRARIIGKIESLGIKDMSKMPANLFNITMLTIKNITEQKAIA